MLVIIHCDYKRNHPFYVNYYTVYNCDYTVMINVKRAPSQEPEIGPRPKNRRSGTVPRTGERAPSQEPESGHRPKNRQGHRPKNRQGHRPKNRQGHRPKNRQGHRPTKPELTYKFNWAPTQEPEQIYYRWIALESGFLCRTNYMQ